MKNHSLLIGLSVLALSAGSISFAATRAISQVPVTGTLTDGGAFNGTLTITELSEDRDGNLLASGKITGKVSSILIDDPSPVYQSFTDVRADITAKNSCTSVTVDIGDVEIDSLDTFVDLAPAKVDTTKGGAVDKKLGKLLCSVGSAVDNASGGSGLLSGLLGQVNDLLGGVVGGNGPVGGLIGGTGLGGLLGGSGDNN